jgi:hypothetical protein
MRRIVLAMAVAALMAVMVASSAAATPQPDNAGAPISACPPSFPNGSPDSRFGLVPVESVLALLNLDLDSPGVESIDVNNDGLTCFKLNPSGHRVVFVDNHFPLQQ